MNNIGTLIFLFAIVLVFVAILAVVVGYSWASSTTKSALLNQIKEQKDDAFKQAQEQFQGWKQQELNSIRQQTFDAAKGQVIQEMQEQVRNWQQNELQQIRQQMLEGMRGEAIKDAQAELVKWRNGDLESAKRQIWNVLSKDAIVTLEQWKMDVEKTIRQDAIDKSQSVTMGKMTEHMVPFLPGFGFNPSDARFIGSPIDLIVFDGLGNDCINKIVFIEIKTGVSSLSTRERLVRDAILAGKIEWMEVKANLNGPDIVQKTKSRKTLSA
ncbi:MAG: Holliday junction resolvase-like protein [Anaerolineales bacterium]